MRAGSIHCRPDDRANERALLERRRPGDVVRILDSDLDSEFGAPVDDSDLLDRIAAVDAEKVRSVAEDLVSGGAPAIAAIGPDSSVMENQELAALLSGAAA